MTNTPPPYLSRGGVPRAYRFANGDAEKWRKDAGLVEDTERMNLGGGEESAVIFCCLCSGRCERHYVSVKLCPFISVTPFPMVAGAARERC